MAPVLRNVLGIGLTMASVTGDIHGAELNSTPNIVVIVADDVGYGDLACYGATLVKTPHIDRLAREGRRFTDAYSPSSVCSPSRYGLITGQYCWRTSLKRDVLNMHAPLHIARDRLTIASLLKKHGYTTAAIGKWHLGYGPAPQTDYNAPLSPGPRDIGFDYHFGLPTNHGDHTRCYVENDAMIGRRGNERFLLRDVAGMPKGLAEPRIDDRVDLVFTQKATAWIDSVHARPFFLYFAPVAIHEPVTPNKQFRNQSKCGLLGDYIQQLDWCVGQILEALERNKVADNTLVIFFSDNGGISPLPVRPPEYGLILENDDGGAVSAHYQSAHKDALAAGHQSCGILRGRKGSIYEGGHRVPFIARWPKHVPAGTTSDELIGLTDVIATVAGIVGEKLPPDAAEDSYDMGQALRSEEQTKRIREAIVMHNSDGVFAIRQGHWKLIAAGAAPARILKVNGRARASIPHFIISATMSGKPPTCVPNIRMYAIG